MPGRHPSKHRRDQGTRKGPDEPHRLSTFIRARLHDILAAWEAAVRHLPAARELDQPTLLDHIPGLLDRIAEMADVLAAGGRPRLPADLAEVHALERLDKGFDLEQVVTEYAVLRDCIVRLWAEEEAIDKTDSAGVRTLNQAIDRAVGAAVQRYTIARDRTLQSLDRISAAALETRSLDEFLDRLLRVLLETTAAVDSAAILLRDGDMLYVRASAGVNKDRVAGWSTRIGEGFAGLIARTRRPYAVQSAVTDPLVLDPGMKADGVKGLFGVPLIEGGEVIGVAHMGSFTAPEFSKQDQRLFEAMAHRVTSAISLHMLREAADRHARQQQAIAALGIRALASGELDALFATVVRSVADTLAVELTSILEVESDDAFVMRAETGWGPGAVGAIHVPRSDRSQEGLTLRTGQPVIVDDVGAETRFAFPDQVRERGIQSGLTVPIRLPGELEAPYGVLGVHTVRPSAFRSDDVAFLQAVGHILGNAIALRRAEADRARALEQLRERELRFRSIADNIPQLAWMTDETGSVIWYNRRWYELTGTTFEQMQGWGWQAVHHPDHIARVVEKFRRHIAAGEAWEDTFPMRAADGRYRWFLSRAVPIRDEGGRVVSWFGSNTDVSEQRFMHEAMTLLSSSLAYRETLARLARLAVPALGDFCAIDVVDETGITCVATAYADPEKAELARRSPRDPRAPRAPAGVSTVIRTGVTAHEPGEGSYVIAPLVARDRTLGAISFVSAESGRRYTDADIGVIEELGRRAGLAIDNARLFEAARREAHMREEILAVVSHDLRDPLGAIHLAATMLLEKPELYSRKHLETIHRAAGRMDHLIGDLLDMASIQAGRLAIERKPEDVDAILREVLESHVPMAKEKGLTLAGAVELRGVNILVDKNRILQVFGNLIGNAIKFCRPGDTITIRGERRDAEAELAVANSGPEISEPELPHIFEPYWSAKKYAKQGIGLGLYISKGIIEAHGGRIRVESAPGEGTTFYFTIPLVP